ncbi:MAG: hypothetical protein JO097_06060 [Acidobacteriaceae bacterium]|nr:hypothetical protein [Acidobacteriaceae bacterium]
MSTNANNLNAQSETITAILELHFSSGEIAERLHSSEQTIIRLFQDQPGVLKIRKGLGNNRDYVTLRIPESMLRKVIEVRSR